MRVTGLPTAWAKKADARERIHPGFDDPAKATGSEEEVFAVFRRVRDEIGKVFGACAAGMNLGMQLSR